MSCSKFTASLHLLDSPHRRPVNSVLATQRLLSQRSCLQGLSLVYPEWTDVVAAYGMGPIVLMVQADRLLSDVSYFSTGLFDGEFDGPLTRDEVTRAKPVMVQFERAFENALERYLDHHSYLLDSVERFARKDSSSPLALVQDRGSLGGVLRWMYPEERHYRDAMGAQWSLFDHVVTASYVDFQYDSLSDEQQLRGYLGVLRGSLPGSLDEVLQGLRGVHDCYVQEEAALVYGEVPIPVPAAAVAGPRNR